MNANLSYSPERLSWVVTSVTLTFDFWPWPFAWTSLLSLGITPENFMMIQWWEHGEKGVTDGQTDGQTDRWTDWTIHRAAWSQLKCILWSSLLQWMACHLNQCHLTLNEAHKSTCRSIFKWHIKTFCHKIQLKRLFNQIGRYLFQFISVDKW